MSQVFKFDDYQQKKHKTAKKTQHRYSTEDIENIVKQLYQKHDLQVNTLDLFDLGEKENINILNTFFPNPKVVLLIRDFSKSKFIYVRKDMTEKEKNFLIAHALGHLILHKQNGSLMEEKSLLTFDIKRMGGSHIITKEVEANKFAYILLMPKDIFLAKYKETHSIFELSEYFKVPEKAVLHRLRELMEEAS